MPTKLRGSADVGDLHQSSNSTTPRLDQKTPFRIFVHSYQRRLTRAFEPEENVGVPEILDSGQPVVQHREAEEQPTTPVELATRPSSVEEDEDTV